MSNIQFTRKLQNQHSSKQSTGVRICISFVDMKVKSQLRLSRYVVLDAWLSISLTSFGICVCWHLPFTNLTLPLVGMIAWILYTLLTINQVKNSLIRIWTDQHGWLGLDYTFSKTLFYPVLHKVSKSSKNLLFSTFYDYFILFILEFVYCLDLCCVLLCCTIITGLPLCLLHWSSLHQYSK